MIVLKTVTLPTRVYEVLWLSGPRLLSGCHGVLVATRISGFFMTTYVQYRQGCREAVVDKGFLSLLPSMPLPLLLAF